MSMPVLQVRNSEGKWCVHVQFPDGSFEEICGFESENEASKWAAQDFQRWLDQREQGLVK